MTLQEILDDLIEKFNKDLVIPPPIGIVPEFIWKQNRLKAINDVIKNYIENHAKIPIEWIIERNKLLDEIIKNK